MTTNGQADPSPQTRSKRIWPWLTAIAFFISLGVAFYVWRGSDQPMAKTFDGDSGALKQTVEVPTLDTPIPEGKSAIWCSSFQIAWNHLRDDLAKGPVQLQNAQAVADRLNQADQSEADLTTGEYYAAAGFVKDGIIDRIRKDMEAKFPQAPASQLTSDPRAAVAYAYLEAEVKYTHPYTEKKSEAVFKDAAGNQTQVASFGIHQYEWSDQDQALRHQLTVLYCTSDSQRSWLVDEFAVDLCKDSTPNQLVVARIQRTATLAEALAKVQSRMAEPPAKDFPRTFAMSDTLLVPNMSWRIAHHFKELEGTDKVFQNPPLSGLYMETALQMTEFTLNRKGAKVASEAKMTAKSLLPREFHCDRPFLLYLKKRNAAHPFFVMWVDNAELLQKR